MSCFSILGDGINDLYVINILRRILIMDMIFLSPAFVYQDNDLSLLLAQTLINPFKSLTQKTKYWKTNKR